MEAEELMIGDWYMNSAKEPCKVVKNFGDTVWGEGNDVADSTDNPLPILLTEEILKANGFVATCGDFIVYRKNDFEKVVLRFCSEDEDDMSEKAYNYYVNHWVVDENYRMDYVHQLQHFLRLCGLNELADNFKV